MRTSARMSFEAVLARLLASKPVKLSLDNVRALRSLLGCPDKAYKTVHVAGTNGKGGFYCSRRSYLPLTIRQYRQRCNEDCGLHTNEWVQSRAVHIATYFMFPGTDICRWRPNQ